MRFLISLLLVTACSATSDSPAMAQAPAAAVPVTQPNSVLRDELLAMAREDQRIRREWIKKPDDSTIKAEAVAIDQRNQARIVEIVERYGWPGRSLVGEKASGAAWTLLQHSSMEILHRYLPLMEAAARLGELDWSLVATTIDRMRINEGKPQVYGTQFRRENGEWVPYPIEDEPSVDERRKSVGLQPLAEYAETLRNVYQTQPKTPK